MSTIYVGDLHGRLKSFKAVETMAKQTGVKTIIQVGDFGLLFHSGCEVFPWFCERTEGPIWITCGGNHDNWPLWRQSRKVTAAEGFIQGNLHELAPGVFFADRNTVIQIDGKKHLFFGGAESTDKLHRVEGRDWWPEETPTYSEFCDFVTALEVHKPEVVVTHDTPLSVPIQKYDRKNNPTPRNLENVWNLSSHKPEKWYFGHHHVTKRWFIENTEFICTGLHGAFSF